MKKYGNWEDVRELCIDHLKKAKNQKEFHGVIVGMARSLQEQIKIWRDQ